MRGCAFRLIVGIGFVSFVIVIVLGSSGRWVRYRATISSTISWTRLSTRFRLSACRSVLLRRPYLIQLDLPRVSPRVSIFSFCFFFDS
jgi:hypothetical protein